MNEHPDIEELSSKELSTAVKEHVEDCDICSQILEDMKMLEIDLHDLNKKVDIPEYVDRNVALEITLRSEEIRRIIFRKNLLTSISAIAAVLILSFTLFTNLKTPQSQLADINGDGEINVLDSLVLAQNIDRQSSDKKFDQNGDGLIDKEDLLIVRNAVVSLEGKLP